MKRLSAFSGEVVDMPAKLEVVKEAAKESRAITELLGLVTQSQERIEAVQTLITELTGRVAQLEQQLMQAVNKPAQQIPAPVVNVPVSSPVAYEMTVSKRDYEGRVEKVQLIPRGSK